MKLSRVNNLLLTGILLVNLYIIAGPLVPAMSFWWQNRGGTARQTLEVRATTPSPKGESVLRPNTLIIPSMLLDQPVLEGAKKDMYRTLDKGIWRWPASSTPDKGGNTVLLGHRFTYTNPNGVLYHLDKVRVGDTIGVVWDNRSYTYKVTETKVVAPSVTGILAPSDDNRLTIYTCAPLWKPVNRLVVVANLDKDLE